MIYAELSGGLGNQMFVYAFARALGLAHREPVTLIDRQDWKEGAPAHTVCGLGQLTISPEVQFASGAGFAKEHLPLANACKAFAIRREQRGGMMARDWNGFERHMAPLFNLCGLHFATDGYVPVHRGFAKDFLLWGYFQGEAYFAPYRSVIRAELRPVQDPARTPSGAALAEQIAAARCPVCVHIRRGDYLNPANAPLQVCGPAYYARAAAEVKQQYPEATLFVFSDDTAWARQYLNTAGLPTVFAGGDRTAADDLALMQRCRHFVLSNSTFSWWAQYLGNAKDKRVFAPDRWYANGKRTALYQPDFQKIAAG